MLEVIEDVPLLYWLNDIYRVAGLVEVWVGIGVGGLGIGDWILQGGFGDDVVGFVDGFVIWRRITILKIKKILQLHIFNPIQKFQNPSKHLQDYL